MRGFGLGQFGVIILAGGMGLTGVTAFAQDQSKGLPDAQIESNVLRALASAPELSTQNIQTSTVYGTVTLTGNVHDESLRVKAENLAARAEGVKKVVDDLTLGDTPAATSNQTPDAGAPPPGQVLQSDGTYAPAPNDGQQPGEPGPPMEAQNGQQVPPPQQGYPQQAPPQRRPMYQNYGPPTSGPQGGQRAGVQVTVPAGSVLRVRINRGIDSNHTQPGTTFDGTVLSDVASGGLIAIPRGATVQGQVIDAKKAGALKGQGELSLQLNSVTLGGAVYPLVSEVWQREGRDKTASTVNSAIGMGALGAIVGAVAGGGAGAAVGAGVGGAVGVAGSAASPRGQIILPPESILTFKIAQPTMVQTVSQQEMARLAYAAGPGPAQPVPVRRRYYSPYYGYYYGPAYPAYPPPPPPQ